MHYISDLSNRLSVSSLNRLKFVIVRNSKLVVKILYVIYRLGYIFSYKILNRKFIKVNMKYINSEQALRGMNSISKPSLKIYLKKKNIQRYLLLNKTTSSGFVIISTNIGLMTDVECIFCSIGGKPLVAIY